MPLRPCLDQPCPNFVLKGRCIPHKRARAAARAAEPHRAVYQDKRWRYGTRPAALRRAGYRCEVVKNGERCTHTDPSGRTLQVHHHPLGVRELLELGLNPFALERVAVACEYDHGLIGQHAQSEAR